MFSQNMVHMPSKFQVLNIIDADSLLSNDELKKTNEQLLNETEEVNHFHQMKKLEDKFQKQCCLIRTKKRLLQPSTDLEF